MLLGLRLYSMPESVIFWAWFLQYFHNLIPRSSLPLKYRPLKLRLSQPQNRHAVSLCNENDGLRRENRID